MNTHNEMKSACTCTDCIGPSCPCGCQTPAAAKSSCACGCQQAQPCQCGPKA